MRVEVANIQSETEVSLAEVKAEFAQLRRDLTMRLALMLGVAVAIIVAAMRYFALHPEQAARFH